jgi:hypothetical protein
VEAASVSGILVSYSALHGVTTPKKTFEDSLFQNVKKG